MKRQQYFNYIEEHLVTLSYRVKSRGKLNVLDLNLHSENFYRDFLNLLYGWNLENLNKVNQNVEAIDLIDNVNKIVVQVSSINTKQKIEDALSKGSMAAYKGWTFKFISIANIADNLRDKTYVNPNDLKFFPADEIYDRQSFCREIFTLTIERMKDVYDFIRKELGNEATFLAIESDLAKVITMLAQVDWTAFKQIKLDNEFQIDAKIDYNELVKSKAIIKEYNIYQRVVQRVYSAFDSEGLNKSFFVLQKIRAIYLRHPELKGDALFDAVCKDVKTEIKNHASSEELSLESIDICSEIVVVDAFLRCKIFENPEGYSYVTT